MAIIPRCSEIGSLGEQCMKPPTPHDRHHGWWRGVETEWSTPTLAEQHTTALADQSKRYARNPIQDDAGEADDE